MKNQNENNQDATRAPKGGMIGKNNEFYAGGQFLPSSENTIKGANKRNSYKAKAYMAKKQEVAPYKWMTPPSETERSIWEVLSFNGVSFKKTGYSKETGSQGKVTPRCYSYYAGEYEGTQYLNAAGITAENVPAEFKNDFEVQNELCRRWNAGTRWFDVYEFGGTYKFYWLD